jgi:hypothetical protein
MVRFISFLFLVIIFVLSACNDNSAFLPVEEQPVSSQIPDELVSYFQQFEVQAHRRGVVINLSDLGITAEFENINENRVIGTCTTNGYGLRHVSIDLPFWKIADLFEREMLIFHELGHCALDRDHNNAAFSNGICQSIMNSGEGNCRDAYNTENRPYYLDELFGLK